MPFADPDKRREYGRLQHVKHRADPAKRAAERAQSRTRRAERKDDPEYLERCRSKNARYRAKNREKLSAAQKARIDHLKATDPIGLREKERAARQRFWAAATDETKQKYAARNREKARARWATIKDDPEVKRKNKEHVTAHLRKSLQYRLGHSLRTRLNSALRNKSHNSSAVRHLGCSLDELIAHLQRQFMLGMSWDNWSPDGWHIDHVKPLRSFDLTDPAQYVTACHYTNLQPLWAFDNISKGARH